MAELDKLIQAANEGDTSAMVELSHYYFDQKEMQKAEEWADKAADAGSGEGTYLSMITHSLGISSTQALGFWELMGEEARIVMQRANVLLRAHKEGVIQMQEQMRLSCLKGIDDGAYGLALSIYCTDKEGKRSEDVCEWVDVAQTTKARALECVSRMDMKDYAGAFKAGQQMCRDNAYIEQEKDVMDEAIFAQALKNMSAIYRIGLPGTVNPDMEKAVTVLNMGINNIKDAEMRNHLKDERNRYQKKVFGGYKYV